MLEQTSLYDYWLMLNGHDWYYDYSDSHAIWVRGSGQEAKLRAIARQSPEHNKMFEGFRTHMFSGSTFNSEKKLKPEKPDAEPTV